jgi:hypothetical protein
LLTPAVTCLRCWLLLLLLLLRLLLLLLLLLLVLLLLLLLLLTPVASGPSSCTTIVACVAGFVAVSSIASPTTITPAVGTGHATSRLTIARTRRRPRRRQWVAVVLLPGEFAKHYVPDGCVFHVDHLAQHALVHKCTRTVHDRHHTVPEERDACSDEPARERG